MFRPKEHLSGTSGHREITFRASLSGSCFQDPQNGFGFPFFFRQNRQRGAPAQRNTTRFSSSALSHPFLGEGSPTKIDVQQNNKKKSTGTLILTSQIWRTSQAFWTTEQKIGHPYSNLSNSGGPRRANSKAHEPPGSSELGAARTCSRMVRRTTRRPRRAPSRAHRRPRWELSR